MDEQPFTTALLLVAGAFPVLLGGAAIALRSELGFGIAVVLALLYVPTAMALGD